MRRRPLLALLAVNALLFAGAFGWLGWLTTQRHAGTGATPVRATLDPVFLRRLNAMVLAIGELQNEEGSSQLEADVKALKRTVDEMCAAVSREAGSSSSLLAGLESACNAAPS